jgi:CDP-diacylglycerol--serine O-phosphatidyltransferase
MRKIYIVPNLVTTANLFSGFYSITASIQGDYQTAAWAIMVAGVFDTLDGRIARLAKATSPFGVEYDSLSDLISFGMAPAILLFQSSLSSMGRLGVIASFFYLCCAALRLARFNINTGVFSKAYFQGVASPVAAGAVATFFIFQNSTGWPMEDSLVSVRALSLVFAFGLGALMVSSIPFPSFKEFNWRARSSFGYLMIGVATMVFIALNPEGMLFPIIIAYLILSLVWNIYRLVTKKPIVKLQPTPLK